MQFRKHMQMLNQRILIPAGKELFTEIMEQQTIPDQVTQIIYVEQE